MRERLLSIFIVVILVSNLSVIHNDDYLSSSDDEYGSQQIVIDDIPNSDVSEFLSNAPRGFTANHGQLGNDEVLFYDQGGGVWFTAEGVFFELRDYAEPRGQGSYLPAKNRILNDKTMSENPIHNYPAHPDSLLPVSQGGVSKKDLGFGNRDFGFPTGQWRPSTNEYKRVILKQEFVNANEVKLVCRERLSWNSNFFYGNISEDWCTDVPNYAEVWYENIYDGIDLRYYTNDKGLKYDLIVHPGADPNHIRMKYNGAESIEIDSSNNLRIRTEIEDLIDGGLFCYQMIDGKQKKIESGFTTTNNQEFGFELTEHYDPNKDLIIDPVLFSTYIGGMYRDIGKSIAVDNSGNSYVTGITHSHDFPKTPGAYSSSNPNPYGIIFVSKLNPAGSRLIYSTYIGGTYQEWGPDIQVDQNGNAFIIATTYSTDFPSTPNAYDPTCNQPNVGVGDVIVFRLNHNGSTLVFSTFLGNIIPEEGIGIALAPNGDVLVTGTATHTSGPQYLFPTTPGAINIVHYGNRDAFISKLSNDGSKLLYSGIYGGNNGDWGGDIVTDSNGNAYIAGVTSSTNFPTTSGAFNKNINSGTDGYIVKLNLSSNGLDDLKYGTFIGGDNVDVGLSIALDSKNNIIITGRTRSADFPTTEKAYDRSYNGDDGKFYHLGDCFVSKLIVPYKNLEFSTFIGGSGDDVGWDICTDKDDNILVSGYTNSLGFPLTQEAFDNQCNNSDGFFCKLSGNGTELIYSSYLGGSENDSIEGMDYNEVGIVYFTGWTESLDFNTTPEGIYSDNSGYNDTFVFAFSLIPNLNFTSISLLDNEKPTNKVYTNLKPYTLRVNLINTLSKKSDLKDVKLILDPEDINVQLYWNQSLDSFTELYDPNNYVKLHSSSKASNIGYLWAIDFNLTFNWTYYNEDLFKFSLFATSKTKGLIWSNFTRKYHVENDLVFNGTLYVSDEDFTLLNEYDLVRGGEELHWYGLRTVYENTLDVFPLENEYRISVWNDIGNSWSTSPGTGKFFNLKTYAPKTTNSIGSKHIINITGIPRECDASNEAFSLKIDGDDVTFFDPRPDNQTWHIDEAVTVGISVADIGGGLVDGKSIMYTTSSDGGETYGGWISAPMKSDNLTIESETIALFEDGKDNVIKWRAIDTLGNGPAESQPFNVLVDTTELFFSEPVPTQESISDTNEVWVGITISDNTSGVNVSSIEYSISVNGGSSWGSWEKTPFDEWENDNEVDLKLFLTLPNGAKNLIRWRGYDNAGNGPTRSGVFTINIKSTERLPEAKLLSPGNNTMVDSSSIKLVWEPKNIISEKLRFDLYFGVSDPPTKLESNISATSFNIENLTLGETYYWYVIPKLGYYKGRCISGIWRFTITPEIPSVTLFAPKDGSILEVTNPTLYWYVNYGGFEKVKCDIFIYSGLNLTYHIRNLTSTEYALETGLKNGITYYWQVVPRIGQFQGIASERWSFTIEIDIEIYDLELSLSTSSLEMDLGESTIVKVILFNLGRGMDKFILKLNNLSRIENGINITIIDSNIAILEPQTSKEFELAVSVSKDAKYGKAEMLIEGISLGAEENGLEVSKNRTLTVTISEEKTHFGNQLSFRVLILIIIIILIISIMIPLMIRKKHRAQAEELEPWHRQVKTEKESVAARTPTPVTVSGVAPKPTLTQREPAQEKITQEPAQPQLPALSEKEGGIVDETPIPKPFIAQPVQVPQLPPAAIEVEDNSSSPEDTVIPPETNGPEQPKTDAQLDQEITVTLPDEQISDPKIGSPPEVTLPSQAEPKIEDVKERIGDKEEKSEE
jgi:hypothetical protein